MKYRIWLVVIILFLMGSPGWAITPEAARKELAQENIPYTAEAMLDYVEKGDMELVGRFLAIGMDVDAGNEFGETALMLASEQGHLEMVQLLLVNKADAKAWRDIWGAGQGVGSIDDILSTREVVLRMEQEYRGAIEKLGAA